MNTKTIPTWQERVGYGETKEQYMQGEISDLRARIAELEAKLEVSPDHDYDGIDCRDVTIREQAKVIDELRAALAAARQPGEVEPCVVDTRIIGKHYAAATLSEEGTDWAAAVSLHFSDKSHAQFAFEVLSRAFTAGMVPTTHHPATVNAGVAKAIHYPECWDTAAYPTVESALSEVYAYFKCSECAQVKAGVPEGWRLVPVEPTENMLRAFTDGANQYDSWKEGYRDMLAAAPASPVEAEGQEPTRKEMELAMKLGMAQGTLRAIATCSQDKAIVKMAWRVISDIVCEPKPEGSKG